MKYNQPKIYIPKKYKLILERRFKLEHFTQVECSFINLTPCPFCRDYVCDKCPVGRLLDDEMCTVWTIEAYADSELDVRTLQNPHLLEISGHGIALNVYAVDAYKAWLENVSKHVVWINNLTSPSPWLKTYTTDIIREKKTN